MTKKEKKNPKERKTIQEPLDRMHSVCIVFDFAVNASRPEREREREACIGPAVETRTVRFIPKAGVRSIIGKVAVRKKAVKH